LKIAYFSHSSISPSETFIYDLVKGLDSCEEIDLTYIGGQSKLLNEFHNIKCIATGYSDKFEKIAIYIKKIGQIIGGKGENWKMRFTQIISFRQLNEARLPKFDIAFVEYATSGVLVMNYLEQQRLQFVVHVHGYDITASTNNKAYLSQLKILFEKAIYFIVASQYMKRRLILLGCDGKKIKLIYIGVESSEVKPLLWKEKIKGNPSIIFLGRLTNKKHPIALLHAFKIVLDSIPNATLSIIGDGPMKNDVDEEIVRLDLIGKVKMLGVLLREQSFPIMNEHWIYAQHSVTGLNGDTEGFAISLAEAALHGLPVVSTIHNGITENVLDGKTGFLVPEYDYESMAEKIIYLIQNPDIAEKMGKAGREQINSLCNPKQRVEKIIEILKTIK
jgi:glycosyltransferase involved in cell wall biosynthesis